MIWNNIITKKHLADSIAKNFCKIIALSFSLLFALLVVFVIIASIPGFSTYKFSDIFFTLKYDLTTNKASIWLPFVITIFTSGLAILIATPVAIKTATFIKFRVPARFNHLARIIIELLADIPSVIFGLFAIQSLGSFLSWIFHLKTNYNLINASVMLAFMIIPTITSMTLTAYDGVNDNMLIAPIVLGNTKTRAIYKVFKKETYGAIIVAIIIALARAIGETMAVNMILQAQSYNQVFDSGFLNITTSYLKTLGSLIATNMFAEGGGKGLQGLLFIYGFCLFIFVMLLNIIATRLIKKSNFIKKNFYQKINFFFWKTKSSVVFFFDRLLFKQKNTNLDKNSKTKNLTAYYLSQSKKWLWTTLYDWWKIFWEVICFSFVIGFASWIILDIFINGIIGMSSSSTLLSASKGSTGQAFVNTILVITVAVLLGFPISLAIAIYLNEFLPENSKLKRIMLFFFDSLGATPSILFGMFGLIFFVQTLGWTNNGTSGKSLIAGALTILIVILPNFIRMIVQALQTQPTDIRNCSYALGAGKWETIRKIILPACFKPIATAIALSIGRILTETAPLYLTAGLGTSNAIALDAPGQTLTTRIYAQIYINDYQKANHTMYECALITMLFILLILCVIHILIPKYFQYIEQKKKKIKKYNFKKQTKQKKLCAQ